MIFRNDAACRHCVAKPGAALCSPVDSPAREDIMAGMLDGKVALVTGGGGGIGRATALAMVREGARVAVADFVAAAARDAVAQINAQGGQAITLTGDVTRAEDVLSMVHDTLTAYGR